MLLIVMGREDYAVIDLGEAVNNVNANKQGLRRKQSLPRSDPIITYHISADFIDRQ